MAERQHGVLTRKQALQYGLTGDAVDGRLTSGEWERVFRGVFRLAGSQRTFEQTVMAAWLLAPEGAASHRCAAALHGIPGVPRWVELTVPIDHRVRVRGVIAHRSGLLVPEDCTEVKSIRATSPARTLIDLAAGYPKERLGRMLDHCLANRLLRRSELEERVAALGPGRAGGALVQELLAERPVTARPMEGDFEVSLFMALRAAGVEEPIPQYPVTVPAGVQRFIDFAYPDVQLALEADGYVWHSTRTQWERDRIRSHELIALGWTPLPVTWGLLKARPGEVAETIRRALASRRAG